MSAYSNDTALMLTRRALMLSATATAAALSLNAAAQPYDQDASMPGTSARLFELRNYQTKAGRRDDLIAMFEERFQDAYASAGALVAGSFRNLDDPNRFVWIRAFPGGRARAAALSGFYTSEAWRSGRDACNDTLADASDNLLLQKVFGDLPNAGKAHPPAGAPLASSRFLVTIHLLADAAEEAYFAGYSGGMTAALARLHTGPSAVFLSDKSENHFPRQPVRSDTVLAAVTRFEDEPHLDAFLRAAASHPGLRAAAAALAPHMRAPPVQLRLAPTSRSLMR